MLHKLKRLQAMVDFAVAKRQPRLPPRLKPQIRSVSYKVTQWCNSRCRTCNHWRTRPQNELTTTEAYSLIDQLAQAKVRNLYFTGGEPTLRPDLPLLITRAREQGLRVGISTNGLHLSSALMQHLIDQQVAQVNISIEGKPAFHDEVRGLAGAFKRTLHTIEQLLHLKAQQPPRIVIATTLMQANLDQVSTHILPLVERLGISVSFNLLDFSPYHFRRTAADQLWITDQQMLRACLQEWLQVQQAKPHLFDNFDPDFADFTLRYYQAPRQKEIPCTIGLRKVYVGACGEVYPCWSFPPSGTLRQQSLQEILQSRVHRAALLRMLAKKCAGCACHTSRNHHDALGFQLRRLPRLLRWRLSVLPERAPKRIV